jgi:hypothetical protein
MLHEARAGTVLVRRQLQDRLSDCRGRIAQELRVVDIDGQPWFVLAEEVKPKAWTARPMEKHWPICQKKDGANGP